MVNDSIYTHCTLANLIPLSRKIPWRLSRFQKARQRFRLRRVDAIVATVDNALRKQGTTTRAVELWKEEMPTEPEMLAKDKYTIFDRKARRYRKGVHSEFTRILGDWAWLIGISELPKWTRVSQRLNPPGY